MNRRIERKLDAYRDGALYGRARAVVERRIANDSEAERRVRNTDRLGQAIRSAWSDGPQAPRVDYLIGALRPELVGVDAEIERARLWPRLARGFQAAVRPGSAAALVGACALALFTLLPVEVPQTIATRVADFRVDEPSSQTQIYDLAQGESPLMIFQGQDGSAVIWILDEPDQLSQLSGDGWA